MFTKHAQRALLPLALALCACGDSADTPPTTTTDEGTDVVLSTAPVSGRIGPAGGQLKAPEGHVLQGFSIDVPAGALTSEAELTLDSLLDETPLPEAAARVGPHLVVLADAVVLAKPVQITVPVESAALDLFGVTTSSCAVWQRNDQGWEQRPQVRATEHTVTFETSSLKPIAAGINVVARVVGLCRRQPALCSTVGTEEGTCNSPSGYCMASLGQLTRAPFDLLSLHVEGGSLYYAHVPQANRLTVARLILASNQLSTFGTFTTSGLGPISITSEIALESDGSVWLPTNVGNIRFPSGTGAPVQNDATFRSAGVVVRGGTVTRFVKKSVTVQNRVENRLCSISPNQCAVASADNVRGAPGSGSPSFLAKSIVGVASFSTLSRSTPLTFVRFGGAQGGVLTGEIVTNPQAPTIAQIVIGALEGGPPGLTIFPPPISEATLAVSNGEVGDAHVGATQDDDGRFHTFSPTNASFSRVLSDNTRRSIALTTAEPTSATFQNLLTLAARSIPGSAGRILVLTRGGLIELRRTGQ